MGGIEIATLDTLERNHIIQVLHYTEGHRTQAAQILGISIRTLRNKIARYKAEGHQVPKAKVWGKRNAKK